MSDARPSAGAIVLAAGRSTRIGDEDKLLLPLNGLPVLAHSVRALARCEAVDHVVLVANEVNRDAMIRLGAQHGEGKLCSVVLGGERRQDSVAAGLQALPLTDLVLIHDGARPLVTETIIRDGLRIAASDGAAVVASEVADTIKQVDEAERVTQTPDRSALRAVGTPQVFQRALLERAHAAGGSDVTDDAALVEALGAPIQLYPTATPNPKITRPDDLRIAAALLGAPLTAGATRTGQGVDVHRFDADRALILGGVLIPDHAGLAGHSDGDAVSHAIIDALLGAAALGDIGQHFPSGEERWRGADSLDLLRRCVTMLQAEGYRVDYVDVTIVCETPRLRPHVDEMRGRLACPLAVEPAAVSVKATTSDGLGALGRSEGLQAQAIAGIIRAASAKEGDADVGQR